MAEEQPKNPYAGQGGRFVRHKDGRVERLGEPTKDHDLGNCARDEKGRALDEAIREREPKAPPAPAAAPAAKKGAN